MINRFLPVAAAAALAACSGSDQPADDPQATAEAPARTETVAAPASVPLSSPGDADWSAQLAAEIVASDDRLALLERYLAAFDTALTSATEEIVANARACETDAEITFLPDSIAGDGRDGAANMVGALAYLETVRGEDCIEELPSGLMFRVRTAADESAPSPLRGDMVTVHYRGRLIDGTEFDSSYSRGEPASFPSDRLIAGWVEALPMMRVGESWELFIRPELGYGERVRPGGAIGPNMTLVFELELLDLPGAGGE